MKRCCEMKGFLSFIVLKLIDRGEISGEEIRQEIEKRRGTKPSPGTIYPVLKSLSDNGFIEEAIGKGKTKRYRLTKSGKKEIEIAKKKFFEIFYDMKEEFSKSNYK